MNQSGTSINLRDVALSGIMEILEKDQTATGTMDRILSKFYYLPESEKRFIRRLVYGCCERFIELDWRIDCFANPKTKQMKPVIRNILRLSVYQLFYMDAVPDSAAINEACKLTKKHGFSSLTGFVNGVLRNLLRNREEMSLPDGFLVRYSMPEWITDRYLSAASEEKTEKIFSHFLQEPDGELSVHCHTGKKPVDDIVKSLKEENIPVRRDPLLHDVLHIKPQGRLTGLFAYRAGWIEVQDASSVLAGMAAGVQPGDFCIDVCAAPGGKSLYLADKMKDKGTVIARDRSEEKVGKIRENISRCGFSSIHPEVFDARHPDPSLCASADLVIADVPCSGLGVLSKKPDIKAHMSEEKADNLVKLQREILSACASYVKPGGILLYSTCTVNESENSGNCTWFMSHFPFEPDDLTPFLPSGFSSSAKKDGMLQLLPNDVGEDGFFFARMRKKI